VYQPIWTTTLSTTATACNSNINLINSSNNMQQQHQYYQQQQHHATATSILSTTYSFCSDDNFLKVPSSIDEI